MTSADDVEMFCKDDCERCAKLAGFLTSEGITVVKRSIDAEPDLQTEALMLGIFSIPALKKGDNLLLFRDMFDEGRMDTDKILNFVRD